MEIFQTIWTALTTPNKQLTDIFMFILTFIELTVTMLLFIQILDIQCKIKQKVIYILSLSTWSFFCTLFMPNQVHVFLNILTYVVSIMIIFRQKLLKACLAAIIHFTVIVLLDAICSKLLNICFNISLEQATLIPIYRISIACIIYSIIYLLYRLSKRLNFSIGILDNIDIKSKIIIFINFILVILSIGTQIYIIGFYNDILPIFVVFLSMFSLITYFLLSIFTLTRTTKLQIANENLEEAQLYNKSLKILHDNVRAFKHDFGNIVQAIGRLCGH